MKPTKIENIEWKENPKGELIPNVHVWDIIAKDNGVRLFMVHAIWASGMIQSKEVGNTERITIKP